LATNRGLIIRARFNERNAHSTKKRERRRGTHLSKKSARCTSQISKQSVAIGCCMVGRAVFPSDRNRVPNCKSISQFAWASDAGRQIPSRDAFLLGERVGMQAASKLPLTSQRRAIADVFISSAFSMRHVDILERKLQVLLRRREETRVLPLEIVIDWIGNSYEENRSRSDG